MTTMVKEIYDAFKAAGADDDKASAAAASVVHRDELATKADLVALKADLETKIVGTRSDLMTEIANTRSDLTMRMLIVALGQTALIVGLLRVL